ncbi:MAG TPA: hypothetical protein VJC17_01710 [Candidatus Dojkabacteria bacterium]|nr:hypothetical protein [Candidatus Dojkabacteria bacterium]
MPDDLTDTQQLDIREEDTGSFPGVVLSEQGSNIYVYALGAAFAIAGLLCAGMLFGPTIARMFSSTVEGIKKLSQEGCPTGMLPVLIPAAGVIIARFKGIF